MEAAASSAFRHYEQHLSQDCGDRSRGNGRNWRFTLCLSVSSSAVSVLPKLPSSASGPGPRSPTFLRRGPRISTPLNPGPRSLNPFFRAHILQPWTLVGTLFSVQLLSEHCCSQSSFSCEQHRILLHSMPTVHVLKYLSLSSLETPTFCNLYFDDSFSHPIALGNRI